MGKTLYIHSRQACPLLAKESKNSYGSYIDRTETKWFLRDLYKKRFNTNKNPEDWKNSKNSETQLTKRDQKRNNYFSQKKLNEVRDNIKDTWKVLNMAMGNKFKITDIDCLKVKN